MYYGTESQLVRDSTYTYDAVGNRTDRPATVQAGNRLTYFDGVTMTYDGDGNLLTKTGPSLSQGFSWNGLGQLVSVTTNGNVTTFGYDGLGRRVRKTYNGVTTRYLYDGNDLVMQLDASGARQLEFSYYPGIDHPLAVRSPGSGITYWYATSQPGNVTALVNASNQVVNRYEYTPFGRTLSATEQVVQPFRFAGRQFDSETGLYYNRARYYDPTVGRFISEDPIGLAGGVNQYAYAGNDPINGIDPSGLDHSKWRYDDCSGGTEEQILIDVDLGQISSSCVAGSGGVTVTDGTGPGTSGVNWGPTGPIAGPPPTGGSVGPAGTNLPIAPQRSFGKCVAAGLNAGIDVAADVAFLTGFGLGAKLAFVAGERAGVMLGSALERGAAEALSARFLYGSNPGNSLRLGGRMARDAAFSTSVSVSNDIFNGDGSAWSLLKGFVPFINTFGSNGTLMTAYNACLR